MFSHSTRAPTSTGATAVARPAVRRVICSGRRAARSVNTDRRDNRSEYFDDSYDKNTTRSGFDLCDSPRDL